MKSMRFPLSESWTVFQKSIISSSIEEITSVITGGDKATVSLLVKPNG